MTTNEAEVLIGKRHSFYRDLLNIREWETTVQTQRLPDGTLGRFDLQFAYHRAIISLDPDQHETEEQLERTLRHELIHVMLSDWDNFAYCVASSEPDIGGELFLALLTNAQERAVSKVEQLVDRLTGVKDG
jgi:hypothetical protein